MLIGEPVLLMFLRQKSLPSEEFMQHPPLKSSLPPCLLLIYERNTALLCLAPAAVAAVSSCLDIHRSQPRQCNPTLTSYS